MIKPFKILETRVEPEGGTGVLFEVSKTIFLTETKTQTDTMRSYISVPKGMDIDEYLFKDLQKGGWV